MGGLEARTLIKINMMVESNILKLVESTRGLSLLLRQLSKNRSSPDTWVTQGTYEMCRTSPQAFFPGSD
jgi:hypothetical protein